MNSFMNKTVLASVLTLALSTSAMANIIISEYVEGSSSNKAVEITNIGSTDIDMGAMQYKLALYGNGSATEHETRKIELTGVLSAGASYVVYNAGADPEFQFPDAGAPSELTFFNGDDAIVLSMNGVVVDSIGRVGEDPGSEWTDPNIDGWSTKEATLRRKASVTVGDTVIDDAFPGDNNQWLAFAQNTADGLGCGGELACGATPTVTNTIIMTEYVEGSGSNKAVEITNLGSADVDMGAMKYKLALYGNGSATEHETRKIELTGVLSAGASYVVYNASADPEFQFPNAGAASELTFFNGDDAIVLTQDGTVVDSFGRVGEDPGSEWTDSNNPDWSTKEKTLRRIASVTSGDTVIDDAFPGSPNQWLVFDQNTADGLGCAGEVACGPGGDGDQVENIMITEYVEGSGSNKVVEISNMGSTEVNLSAGNYKLAMFSNGSATEHETRKILLSGILAPGQSFMAYNASGAPEFQFPDNGEASEVTYFNGDDALVLTRDGVVIDSFGRVGEDPGSEWQDPNNSDFSTKEKTLRRKVSVTSGDTVVDDAFPGDNNQWEVFGADTADGLGCPGVDACGSGNGGGGDTPEPIENYILITEYIEGSGFNKAIELSNIGSNDIDLFTEGYRLALYSNGNNDAINALNLFGLLPAGASIVIYNSGATGAFIFDAPQGIESTVTWYNGDDAIVLTKGGVAVDSIGRVGQRPSGGWTSPNNDNFSTKDKTLRRKVSVTVGDHIVNDSYPGSADEWVVLDKDTSDGLGCMGEAACHGAEPLPMVGAGGGVAVGACVGCYEISKVAEQSLFDDNSYYADVINGSAAERATKLSELIGQKHVPLSYGQVWSVLTFSDQDPDNADNVIELYTGNSIAKNMNGSGANAGDPDSWNREHVWSKSHGFPNDNQVAYTDAHHLRPADWSMNTTRSNLDFDNGGDAIEESPINFKDSDSFEPRDEVKGDVARMMFYMASRYNGAEADNTPDLVLVDQVGTSTDTINGVATFGKLCSLWEWHLNDPVDAMEIQRNQVVYEYQGNRNPFIDHPEWVYDIYSWDCRTHTAPVINITGPATVSEGQSVTIDASGSYDPDGESISYHWRQTTTAHISFDYSGSAVTFMTPNVSVDTPITFELTITDGEFETVESFTVVVEANTDSDSIGGALAWLTLLLLPLGGMRRRR